MLALSEKAFFLMCDLNDALADLTIALEKWHTDLEHSFLHADDSGVREALNTVQVILYEMKQYER